MLAINQFKIVTQNADNKSATFRIEPLPKGYANTLGTVLRRILLSSIRGAAITSVKFAGVQHEYTTIAGLQDDVLNIVLALKGVAVKSLSDTPVTLKLSKKGKKGEAVAVTAADIEQNALVEISNPEHLITNLANEKAEIEAEITVSSGVGYSLPDEAVREEVGVIPIDAIFSPVSLVTVEVKNTRVGQQTDLDALELTIHTNGTISPADAVAKAGELLSMMSDHFISAVSEISSAVNLNKTSVAEAPAVTDTKSLPVETAGLSTRLANSLVNAGYTDLFALEGLAEEELRNLKGMGDKTFTELLDILKANGINLL